MPVYTQPPQGQEGTFSRQIGPLKLWQWGALVIAGLVVYKFVLNRDSSNSTNALVPASNTDASGNPIDNSGDSNSGSSGSNTTPPPANNPVSKIIAYYNVTLSPKYRTPIWKKINGVWKKVGSYPIGAKIKVGTKRILINGHWYYPIIGHPGEYIEAMSTFKFVPVYQTVAAKVSTVSVAAPATTAEAQPVPKTFSSQSIGSLPSISMQHIEAEPLRPPGPPSPGFHPRGYSPLPTRQAN